MILLLLVLVLLQRSVELFQVEVFSLCIHLKSRQQLMSLIVRTQIFETSLAFEIPQVYEEIIFSLHNLFGPDLGLFWVFR